MAAAVATTEFAPLPVPPRARAIQIVAGMHGTMFMLRDDGAIFERVRAPGTGIGPEQFTWKQVEGPKE